MKEYLRIRKKCDAGGWKTRDVHHNPDLGCTSVDAVFTFEQATASSGIDPGRVDFRRAVWRPVLLWLPLRV